MTEENLRELGRLMAHVDGSFPLELGGYEREQVLLDFEFKLESNGDLAVKQVRPFLLSEAVEPAPDFELEIPAGTEICGVFSKERTGREPREEYELKSRVRLKSGVLSLATGSDSFSRELIEAVEFGPGGEVGVAEGAGLFRVVRIPQGTETRYRFSFEQSFLLGGGERLKVKIQGLDYRGRGEVALEKRRVLDEEYLTFAASIEGEVDGVPRVSYGSCGYGLLPEWKVEVEGEGVRVDLWERHQPTENESDTGPAALHRAEVVLGGERQEVSDYWRLVYAARRHNRNLRYWVVLEPPLQPASVEGAVRVVEVVASERFDGTPAEVRLLGEGFEVLGTRAVTRETRRELEGGRFRRGDLEGSGGVNLTDVLALLGYLFQHGPEPGCLKSGDANDDGRLNVLDAIAIVSHLFRGTGPLPEPSACGEDPTADGLGCELYAGCP